MNKCAKSEKMLKEKIPCATMTVKKKTKKGVENMYSIHKNPIGIYEKALPNSFTWEEKFQAAKKAGFDYMEISIDESDERLARLDWTDEEIEKLRKVMHDNGIFFPTMCLSGHRKYPFGSKDPEIRERAMVIMEKAINLSVKLGIRCIQLATYDVYYEDSDEETKRLFLAGLKEAVAMASRAGVILAMEIMDTQFVGTIVRAMHYLKEIPSPYFKIYPDMGNLSNFSNDVTGEFELGISETVAIHIKETKPGVFKEVPFGEGQVKFTEIFRKLKELNYQGMFLIEMWADNKTVQSAEKATQKIADAYQFVTGKMKEAGMEVS
jgi:L-ribulose-5-phosphate 3-epimerase/hexulose-6-phosphate isomerase